MAQFPEFREAYGIYYPPEYIVENILCIKIKEIEANFLAKLATDKITKLKILVPAIFLSPIFATWQ
ncbi:MAG: hypothetical protein EAZ97_11905 [Bacteroidetes bacterium]|nr:MAG: hypothetical protein EAZ97_11905 [Bacteroidota bacterium]